MFCIIKIFTQREIVMPTPPQIKISLNAYPVRKAKDADGRKLTPARIESAFVDFDKFTIQLKSGEQARFNPFFNSLNDYVSNPKKPFEYKPMWLHKVDDFIWYEARHSENDSLSLYVRKENNTFIDHKTGKAYPKDEITLLAPSKKLLRCKHSVVTPDGNYFRTTRFVHETAKFYIYQNIDGSKVKYTKKTIQNDPIGFIDLDDENVLFLYPSEDFKGD